MQITRSKERLVTEWNMTHPSCRYQWGSTPATPTMSRHLMNGPTPSVNSAHRTKTNDPRAANPTSDPAAADTTAPDPTFPS